MQQGGVGGAGSVPTANLHANAVPEPGTLALLLVAAACGMVTWRRRKGSGTGDLGI